MTSAQRQKDCSHNLGWALSSRSKALIMSLADWQVEWLRLLLEAFSCVLLWRVFKATATQVLATCRNWPELRRTIRWELRSHAAATLALWRLAT